MLKTISGETDGFFVDSNSQINYQGIPMETMHGDFRGECIYQAEVDVHFPQLTVGQTLEFAARARGRFGSTLRDIPVADRLQLQETEFLVCLETYTQSICVM